MEEKVTVFYRHVNKIKWGNLRAVITNTDYFYYRYKSQQYLPRDCCSLSFHNNVILFCLSKPSFPMILMLTKLMGQTVGANRQCCWNYNGNCKSYEEIIFTKNSAEHSRLHGLSHNVQIRCRHDQTFNFSRSPQLPQCQNRVGSPELTEGRDFILCNTGQNESHNWNKHWIPHSRPSIC